MSKNYARLSIMLTQGHNDTAFLRIKVHAIIAYVL